MAQCNRLGLVLGLAMGLLPLAVYAQTLGSDIAAPGETPVLTVAAEGAQIYECKVAGEKLAWTFREPVATLILDGQTIGRHYAGPHWELADGSIVQGKATARIAGATPADIPHLKLEVITRKGEGRLGGVTTIQRVNTKGGELSGACDKRGQLRAIAYSSDYVFLKK